jgi:hypothetical protein
VPSASPKGLVGPDRRARADIPSPRGSTTRRPFAPPASTTGDSPLALATSITATGPATMSPTTTTFTLRYQAPTYSRIVIHKKRYVIATLGAIVKLR